MKLELTWTAIGVIIVIIGHAIILVRGWTIIEMRLKALTDSFHSLNLSLEKRDAKIDAAWKKIDGHEHRITVIETKCKVALPEEE